MARSSLDESIRQIDVAAVCESVKIEPAVVTDLALIPFESMLNRLFSVAEGLHCHNIQKNVATKVIRTYNNYKNQ